MTAAARDTGARARLGSTDAFFRGGEDDDAHVTSVVPDLLDRPARTFRPWAEVHLGAF